MNKNNKVTEQEIDVVGSSKHTVNIKAIISFVMMVTVFIIGFNFRINKANYLEPEVEEIVSVTTTENMSTTMVTTTSIVTTTTSTSCVTTTPCTTVATTEEATTTTEEECIITIPVNIQVYIDEPVQEDPSPEPIIETEPVVEVVVEESSTEESIDPPIVEEEPVAVEETEPVSMTYIGNLYITGYVSLASTGATITVVTTGWILYAVGIPYGEASNFLEYYISNPGLGLCILFCIMGLLIILKHIKNYKRLINGTESNFKKAKKEKKEALLKEKMEKKDSSNAEENKQI